MKLLIIQARMGSSRLPGKILKTIKGVPLLKIQFDRIKTSVCIDKILIATTTNSEDDAVERFCRENTIQFFRGSDWDVLSRFYYAALPYKPDTIVRITSDCVLHHAEVVDFVVKEFESFGKDYFSNSNHQPEFLEDGFDVEVFSLKALETAFHEAKLLSEREHVTPYIKNCGKFSCGWKKFDSEYHYKLSVDTAQDFQLAEEIFNHFDDHAGFGMRDVISLLKNKPDLLRINKESEINSGYKKSLKEDKNVR